MTQEENPSNRDIIEQYKIYVTMADQVSNRRGQDNRFFISLITGILLLLSFILGFTEYQGYFNYLLAITSLFGIFVCIIWYSHIISYKNLNSAKFKVIQEIESLLTAQPYKREWEILGEGKNYRRYFPLTHIEKYIPLLMSIPFILLFILSIIAIIFPQYFTIVYQNSTDDSLIISLIER